MSNGTVLTLQIDVFDCGEDVGSDFKMPICLNMTAMEEVKGKGMVLNSAVSSPLDRSKRFTS